MILLYSFSGNRKLCPFFLGFQFTTTSDNLSIGIATAEISADSIYIAGQVCLVPTARCRSNVRWWRCRIYICTTMHLFTPQKQFAHTTACQTWVELRSSRQNIKYHICIRTQPNIFPNQYIYSDSNTVSVTCIKLRTSNTSARIPNHSSPPETNQSLTSWHHPVPAVILSLQLIGVYRAHDRQIRRRRRCDVMD